MHYPSDINLGKGVGWDSDVVCGGLIKKNHDLSMFVRLTGLKWPEGGGGGLAVATKVSYIESDSVVYRVINQKI